MLATRLTLHAGIDASASPAIDALKNNIDIRYPMVLADGSGAGQASVLYSSRRTLADGANETLDLNGTALLDALGAAVALTKIKGIIIAAAATNTTTLTIGNVANGLASILGAATQSLTLQPGEVLAKFTPTAAGYAVVAATADLLKVANAAGAAASYDIIIVGA